MRRALIIAIECYSDPRFSPLPGTGEDADGLERVLGDPAIGEFEVMLRRDATVRAAAVAIEDLFHQAGPDDVLLLHISAHGLRDAAGDLYFITQDTDFEHIRSTALSAHDVWKEIRESAARRVIVLIDCCYSGAFTRRDGSRGAESAELDADVRARGHVVITASTAVQLSYEHPDPGREDVRSGLFTRAIVRGLETGDADADGDGIIDTHELHQYVLRQVRGEAGGRQTPTLSSFHVEGALHVARSPRGPRPRPGHPYRQYPPGQPVPRVPLDGTGPRPTRRARLARRLRRPSRLAASLLRWTGSAAGAALAVPLSRRVTGALLVLLVVLGGFGIRADTVHGAPGCPYPTELRVATSPAGLSPYQEVADAYERWIAAREDGCRAVRLYVYPAPGARVLDGLRAGWPESGGEGERYLQDVGPHPDIWLPESMNEVPVDGDARIDATILSRWDVATTPLTLGVPAALVSRADLDQRPGRLSWRDLFSKASRPAGDPTAGPAGGAGWQVVRADPGVSTPARFVTATLYRQPGGLLDSATARRDVERWLEQSLDSGSYPIGDTEGLLCRQRALTVAAGPRPAAVVLTEQALVRFNEGRPLGGPCVARQPPSAEQRLLAFYPVDTPTVKQQVLRLGWSAKVQSPATRAVATDFARWLTSDLAGKRALLDAGFRPLGYDIGAPVGPPNGALPEWPFGQAIRSEPAPETQDSVVRRYAEARRPGRILVALDASGSMRTPTADPTRSRFQVALSAVEQSVTRIGGRDQFGLLTFASGDGADTRELLPIDRQTPARTVAVREAAQRVTPAGDTPLYPAIRRGAELLRAGPAGAQLPGAGPDAESLRALVVLTDGRDTSDQPPPRPSDLAGVRVFTIAIGDVGCTGSVLDQLAAGTGGGCFDATPELVGEVLTKLFYQLWRQA